MDVGFGHPCKLYQKLLCLSLVCTTPTLFKYFYSWPGGGLNSLECQLRLTMLLEFGILIYSTRSYCAYFWCATLQHLQVFLLFARRGSQLFGVSVQTDNGISISHSLYTLPEDIVPTSGVKLSNTFRYFYSWPGGGLNSLELQPTLTVILGFGIPYILYQKLLCVFLVCTSPTLSGISTF